MRLHNDARAIHNLLSLAKMRAAAKFTRVRLYCDLAGESFVLQTWDKTALNWVAEDGPETLSTNVDFSFGALTDPPDDTQAALAQAPACKARRWHRHRKHRLHCLQLARYSGRLGRQPGRERRDLRHRPRDRRLRCHGLGDTARSAVVVAGVDNGMGPQMSINRQRPSPNRRSERGLSLVECVFALSLMTILALGLLPLGVIATVTTENQGHLMARTTEYAQDKLEQLLALAYGDVTSDTRVVSGHRRRRQWPRQSEAAPIRPRRWHLRGLPGRRRRLLPSVAGAEPDGWFYKRVWQVETDVPSANLKQITVTAIVKNAVGSVGRIPQSTVSRAQDIPLLRIS